MNRISCLAFTALCINFIESTAAKQNSHSLHIGNNVLLQQKAKKVNHELNKPERERSLTRGNTLRVGNNKNIGEIYAPNKWNHIHDMPKEMRTIENKNGRRTYVPENIENVNVFAPEADKTLKDATQSMKTHSFPEKTKVIWGKNASADKGEWQIWIPPLPGDAHPDSKWDANGKLDAPNVFIKLTEVPEQESNITLETSVDALKKLNGNNVKKIHKTMIFKMGSKKINSIINEMSPLQVSWITSANIINVDLSGLHKDSVHALNSAVLAALSPQQVKSIFKHMLPAQVKILSEEQIKLLESEDIKESSVDVIKAMQPIEGIDYTDLDDDKFKCLNKDIVKTLKPEQVKKDIKRMTPDQVRELDAKQLSTTTENEFKDLSAQSIKGLKHIGDLSLTIFSNEQLQSLQGLAMKRLSKEHVAESIKNMAPEQIGNLNPEQIELPIDVINSLSDEQVKALPSLGNISLEKLSERCFLYISNEAIKKLSSSQVAAAVCHMNSVQIGALKAHQLDFDASILNGITSVLISQFKTFGKMDVEKLDNDKIAYIDVHFLSKDQLKKIFDRLSPRQVKLLNASNFDSLEEIDLLDASGVQLLETDIILNLFEKSLQSTQLGAHAQLPVGLPQTPTGFPAPPAGLSSGLPPLPGVSGLPKPPAGLSSGLPPLPGVSGLPKPPAGLSSGLPPLPGVSGLPQTPASGLQQAIPSNKKVKWPADPVDKPTPKDWNSNWKVPAVQKFHVGKLQTIVLNLKDRQLPGNDVRSSVFGKLSDDQALKFDKQLVFVDVKKIEERIDILGIDQLERLFSSNNFCKAISSEALAKIKSDVLLTDCINNGKRSIFYLLKNGRLKDLRMFKDRGSFKNDVQSDSNLYSSFFDALVGLPDEDIAELMPKHFVVDTLSFKYMYLLGGAAKTVAKNGEKQESTSANIQDTINVGNQTLTEVNVANAIVKVCFDRTYPDQSNWQKYLYKDQPFLYPYIHASFVAGIGSLEVSVSELIASVEKTKDYIKKLNDLCGLTPSNSSARDIKNILLEKNIIDKRKVLERVFQDQCLLIKDSSVVPEEIVIIVQTNAGGKAAEKTDKNVAAEEKIVKEVPVMKLPKAVYDEIRKVSEGMGSAQKKVDVNEENVRNEKIHFYNVSFKHYAPVFIHDFVINGNWGTFDEVDGKTEDATEKLVWTNADEKEKYISIKEADCIPDDMIKMRKAYIELKYKDEKEKIQFFTDQVVAAVKASEVQKSFKCPEYSVEAVKAAQKKHTVGSATSIKAKAGFINAFSNGASRNVVNKKESTVVAMKETLKDPVLLEAMRDNNTLKKGVRYNNKTYKFLREIQHPIGSESENIVRLKGDIVTVIESGKNESMDPDVCRKMVSPKTIQQNNLSPSDVKCSYKGKEITFLEVIEQGKEEIIQFLKQLNPKDMSPEDRIALSSFFLMLGGAGIIEDNKINVDEKGNAAPLGFNDDLKKGILKLVSDEAANDQNL